MKALASIVILAVAALAAVSVTGCARMPTEKQHVADLRPSISFRIQAQSAGAATVLVDGIEAGQVWRFVDGEGALRVLPGSHRVQVVNGEAVLLDENVYLGDGVNRTFILN